MCVCCVVLKGFVIGEYLIGVCIGYVVGGGFVGFKVFLFGVCDDDLFFFCV